MLCFRLANSMHRPGCDLLTRARAAQRRVLVVVLSVLLGGSGGCGYTLVGSTPGAAASRVTLAVIPFVNRTHEPELESQLTAAMRRALLRHRSFRLTTAASARQHLSGTVRQFRVYPVAFDAEDNALQYRLEASVRIRLTDEASRQTILEQEISTWAEYLTSTRGDVREEVVAKEAAVFLLAQRFASQCSDLLTITQL